MIWLKAFLSGFKRLRTIERAKRDLFAYKAHLIEREAILNKIQKNLDSQKTALLGKDGLEARNKILLPAMKQKWEAEARLIDAERGEILARIYDTTLSLDARKIEYENQVRILKGKPQNMGNQMLLNHWDARLKELNEIIQLADQERAKNAKNYTPPFTVI